jgi:hypothetical protein
VEVDVELDTVDCLVLRRDGSTLRRGFCVPCGFGLVFACRRLADGDGRDALPEQALHMAADVVTRNTFTLAFLYVCTQPWTAQPSLSRSRTALTSQHHRPSSASFWW